MSSTDKDLNLDLITGAHPVGAGVGAAAGGATGAAVGSVAGPIGTAVGAVIGAVVGGMAGKSVDETVDPTAEEAYWRESYTREPCYRDGHTYDDCAPAYGLGIGSLVADKYRDRSFDDIEGSLAEEWDIYRGNSRLNWTEASTAARAAWARAQRDRGAVSTRAACAQRAGRSAATIPPRRRGQSRFSASPPSTSSAALIFQPGNGSASHRAEAPMPNTGTSSASGVTLAAGWRASSQAQAP